MRRNPSRSALSVLITWLAMGALAAGCAPRNHIPTTRVISAGNIAEGHAGALQTDAGYQILAYKYGNQLLHKVQGTFAQKDYDRLMAEVAAKPAAEREAMLKREISKIFAKVRAVGGLPLSEDAELGYFTFLLPVQENLMSSLKDVNFGHELLLNPVVYDPNAVRAIKSVELDPEMRPGSSPRGDTDSFSGLERIHAPEFVATAEADIGAGAVVNGSTSRVGITDTGITYNHPTFLSRIDGHNRIAYLKDFTGEGRIYFNPSAKFDVTTIAGSDDLLVNAEFIFTPRLPSVPAADALSKVENLRIQVSPELRKILTTPGSGAKLGLLNEDAFQGDEGQVDINANGTTDDKLWAILVPGPTPEQDSLYLDANAESDGQADFRDSKPLHDWNSSHETMAVYAESFGFEMKAVKLPLSNGEDEMEVRSASVVGFDPGNHGSHVAGIAAGSKTIQNDSNLTLARGVAPEATIVLNRVCANNGGCDATEALIDLALYAHPDVINMSLGGLSPFNDGYGVQETVINRLTSLKNILFVISAGNSGPGRQTVGSPSVARLALSVGASASRSMIERQYGWPGTGTSDQVDADDDFMLFFSSRGPTANGGFKPNVAAPGTELSSVELNAGPGSHAGLDVYWGTSMAAPTATGAYALFLDAVHKYNAAHPDKPLSTDAITLRKVLIESAHPFDVSRYDVQTGEKATGQYTWIDEGTGLIDLVAAWKKLKELRDNTLPTAVTLNGNPVDLDYQVIVPMISPTGIAYDGSRAADAHTPAFGTGIYLDYNGTDTLRQVHIHRALPETLAASPDGGNLTRQLVTTADEFVLKTVIYGSDKNWLKVGVLDALNCSDSPTANLLVVGRGADLTINPDGTGAINANVASTLDICIDREMIAHELPQGDNGALISAYRVVDGKVATLPSFTVPVYVTVPHKTLAGSTAYETTRTVRSFGVSRNYVRVPVGTSVVKVTLEVPALKLTDDGRVAPGQNCSGVEMMMLEGSNVSQSFSSRYKARISSCDRNGRPAPDSSRILTLTRTNPTPGMWDLHVFGQYGYKLSQYKLRVDYLTAESEVSQITGGLSALTGQLNWSVRETTLPVVPDQAKSALELDGLRSTSQAQVSKGDFVIVPNPVGLMRVYPSDAEAVTITTGGSPGNDIDLTVLECAATATSPDDPSCARAGMSGGSTDQERVTFKPRAEKAYAVRVDGYDIKDAGNFVSVETVELPAEKGSIAISSTSGTTFQVQYAMSPAQLAASRIATDPLFTSSKYQAVGDLTLRAADETVLGSIPVVISAR